VLRHTFALASLLAALIVLPDHADAGTGPVQVFILAGQSNMVGYGKSENGRNVDYDPDLPQDFHTNWPEAIGGPGSLRYMVANDWATFGAGGTNPLVADTVTLADVLDTSNKPLDWRVRDDVNVYISIEKKADGTGETIRQGAHTTGFGKGNNRSTSYPQIWNGPEYGFGLTVGNAMDQDALIIKVATGGTSLDVQWLSPTAATRRSTSVGYMWPHMLNTVNDVLANLDTEFPEYAGRTHEIAGFGWHQGVMLGDVDGDGDIDNVDIGSATGNFTGACGSTTMTWADGDMDGDGDVDNVDIGTITGAFTGSIIPQPASFDTTSAHTVPEPTTLALLALTAA
jgi:hypothetical protein